MLIIACMDGASASLRRTHTRTYTSDVVEAAVCSYDVEYKMESVRSGGIFHWCGYMRRFILKHNSYQNNLLAVGKSYGGYNINWLIKSIEDLLNYDLVHLILIDPCWIGKAAAGSVISMPWVNRAVNFYQRNNPALNGANTVPKIKEEFDLTKDGVDHFSIVDHPQVLYEIKRSILRLTA